MNIVKEYDDVVHVDKHNLDKECEEQPYLVWEYGKLHATAIRKLDEARATLKVTEAEIDVKIRETPEKYGLNADKKPAEMAIKTAMYRSKQYKAATQAVIEAQEEVNLLDAALRSLDHRRTTLTILDRQDERGYFAKPTQKVRTDSDDFGQRRKRLKKKRRNAQ